jgi:hypothetical protein
MTFTIILALFGLLGLGIVFGIAYKIKGLKFGLITSGIALIVLAVLYVAALYTITSTM